MCSQFFRFSTLWSAFLKQYIQIFVFSNKVASPSRVRTFAAIFIWIKVYIAALFKPNLFMLKKKHLLYDKIILQWLCTLINIRCAKIITTRANSVLSWIYRTPSSITPHVKFHVFFQYKKIKGKVFFSIFFKKPLNLKQT